MIDSIYMLYNKDGDRNGKTRPTNLKQRNDNGMDEFDEDDDAIESADEPLPDELASSEHSATSNEINDLSKRLLKKLSSTCVKCKNKNASKTKRFNKNKLKDLKLMYTIHGLKMFTQLLLCILVVRDIVQNVK